MIMATRSAEPATVLTWIGLLDLDQDGPTVGVGSILRDDHLEARILIRLHGAPIGFVSLPSQPEETLATRARLAAASNLSDGLNAHVDCDDLPLQNSAGHGWAERTSCPSQFPTRGSLGVTVAVPTRDRPELLRDCISTLQQVCYEPLEILIVDNAPSTSATRELVTKLARDDPRITYTCEPSPGISEARNHALATARFDIVAFTDDDVLVDSGWISAIAAGFTADPEVTCVTGFVAPSALDNPFQRYFDNRYPHQGLFAPSRYDMREHRQASPLYPFTAGLFGRGANMALQRSFALSIGGFDTLLGVGAPCRGGEDLDLFVRILLAGGRISYMPAALIWHRHRENADALNQAVYLYGYGLGAYLSKYLPNRELRTGLVGYAVRQAIVHAGRMLAASESSQLGARSARLAVSESYGVLAGALRYRVARRRARVPPVGSA
jgi:glycosyltransferase involved in cell wall biosynthesis